MFSTMVSSWEKPGIASLCSRKKMTFSSSRGSRLRSTHGLSSVLWMIYASYAYLPSVMISFSDPSIRFTIMLQKNWILHPWKCTRKAVNNNINTAVLLKMYSALKVSYPCRTMGQVHNRAVKVGIWGVTDITLREPGNAGIGGVKPLREPQDALAGAVKGVVVHVEFCQVGQWRTKCDTLDRCYKVSLKMQYFKVCRSSKRRHVSDPRDYHGDLTHVTQRIRAKH